MIENFRKDRIGPCSYDLTLGELFAYKKKTIDVNKNKLPEFSPLKLPYVLKPNELVMGRSVEIFHVPLDLMAIFKMRSTAFRLGLNILIGVMDPGYNGEIVFGIHNISKSSVVLHKGMSLVQGVFINMKGDAVPIQTKYMGGKLI